jgi:hypothetical protein
LHEPLLHKQTQTDFERQLKNDFRKVVAVIVVANLFNCFVVFFHKFDAADSEQTLRYNVGTVLFFLMFIALFSIQTYVMIDGFVLYYKWRQLIIPTAEALSI